MCVKHAAQQVHHHYNNIRNIIHDDVMITPQLLMSQKPNSDPSVAKNYRPVVISSTLAKLIEVHILRECNHEFHDLQFGFIESQGTTMAASLTHDVISYFVSHGSPVYACSLDAEGAFDALPHPVIFYSHRCHPGYILAYPSTLVPESNRVHTVGQLHQRGHMSTNGNQTRRVIIALLI